MSGEGEATRVESGRSGPSMLRTIGIAAAIMFLLLAVLLWFTAARNAGTRGDGLVPLVYALLVHPMA
jgi:hypothetical protein